MLNGGHALRHASGARLSSSILRGSSASFAEPSVITSAPCRDSPLLDNVTTTSGLWQGPRYVMSRPAGKSPTGRAPAGYLASEARSSVSLAGGTVIFTGVLLKSE